MFGTDSPYTSMPVVVLFKDFYVEAYISATFSVSKSS